MEAFRNPSLPARSRAEDLLPHLTIKEKVGQLNQKLLGFGIYERNGDDISFTDTLDEELQRWGGLGTLYGLFRADPWSGKDFHTGIPTRLAAKAHNQLQKKVIEASRFGIPALMSSECPHGHQALDGYLLPVCLAIGASFSPELVRSAFGVVGKQLKSQGVDFALMSVLDVLRDPRWGRSEECFSEDPHLCAVMAAAAVTGCKENGVDAVVKHLCAQGQTTGGLNASPASIGERELREIHLPPAEASIKAGAMGVMAAYNEIDGIPCHANPKLLRDILRGEWGFEGIVMADGVAIDRLNDLTGDNAASGALTLQSGVDVSLWDNAFTRLEEAIARGLVSEAVLDEAVLRVLTLKFERGLFDSPYLDEDTPPQIFSVDEYPQSLELARQSIVLLKNENGLLPLKKQTRKIAVIGPAADDLYLQLGDYTPPVDPSCAITLWQGLQQQAYSDSASRTQTHSVRTAKALPVRDSVSRAQAHSDSKLVRSSASTPCTQAPEGITLVRAQGCGIRDGSQESIDQAVALAKDADVVILALGGSSSRYSGARFDTNGAAIHDGDVYMDCGEGVDCASLTLPGFQHSLAAAVYAAGVPVITVVTAGRPYAIPDIAQSTNALVYAFYPGPWGGKAIAELLFGDINPSGRLPATLPRNPGQLPCYYNRKDSGAELRYCDSPNSPLYNFGFGLSYTSFKAEHFQAKRSRVRFTLKNTGEYGGYAVPMLFIRWMRGDVTPREKELKAFSKVWLEPGEAREVVFELDEKALFRWNSKMEFIHSQEPVMIILEEGGKEIWRGMV